MIRLFIQWEESRLTMRFSALVDCPQYLSMPGMPVARLSELTVGGVLAFSG